MKLTKIKISSLYGIKNLELDGSPVEIRGGTGAGKTSVIDSIRFALTNRSERDYIVKQGEREGEIFIETDTGIAINRKKRIDSSDYSKITQNGKAISSPQSFINEIFTPLQLNPVEFASWDKNTQNRAILDLIEFDWDIEWIKEQFGEIPKGINYKQHILQVLEDIQAKNSIYWQSREDCNRKELYKRQQMADIANTIPKNYNLEKWEKYNLPEKIKELQCFQNSNAEIERAETVINAHKNNIRGLQADRDMSINLEKQAIDNERTGLLSSIERLKAEIKSAEEKLDALSEKSKDKIAVIISKYEEKCAKLSNDVKTAQEYEFKEKTDILPLQKEIDEAVKMKEYISEYKSMLNMKAECKKLKEESEAFTDKITIARSLPGKVLETATIPINGLTVSNGIPLINGLPISNLSGGEQISLCVEVTLASKNNLQLILLDGVEALDNESRENLYKKCKEKGLQIIAARTTDDNEFNIVEL